MNHKIPGSSECLMYHLHFIGGPKNGEIVNSFRPYHKMQNPDGSIYEAADPDNCLEWIDDWTRKIELHFDPEGTWP